jgi:hypothetical protein
LIKINDRVHPVFNMSQVGKVVQVRFAETGMHLLGGTSQQRMFILIKLEKDGSLIEVPADEAMRCD